jgi:two-component system chemotaxis response regulator CheB
MVSRRRHALRDPAAEPRSLQVLVVDDSAVVRQVMTAILSREPGMTVTAAADPFVAMERIARVRPDVIVLDLEMPRMDGLTFLHKIMTEDPIPVVICSSFTGAGTEAAVLAMEEGAVEIVTKPKLGLREFFEESAVLFVDAVRAAARARVGTPIGAGRGVPPKLSADAVIPGVGGLQPAAIAVPVVAVGASTGGTDALRDFLQGLPADSPGLVIVQHMPERFTKALADRLNRSSRIEVREAQHGDRVTAGRALIAPGNRHLVLVARNDSYAVEVRDGPLVSRHRPSVDVLFRSVAQVAGPNAVGVIMTGMGDDGAQGMVELKRAGAATIAQDEATSVVFGMAAEAIARGVVDDVLPLGAIAAAVVSKTSDRFKRIA